ncbi:MAG: hypothetical protein U0T81_05780 [Saprospiraceae bacterium]
MQAEGNTRQIQEFDRLYIELKKNNSSLIAGDFDLSRPQGYFMNYFKKSQGGRLQHQHQLGQWKIKESASIGISEANLTDSPYLSQTAIRDYKISVAATVKFYH